MFLRSQIITRSARSTCTGVYCIAHVSGFQSHLRSLYDLGPTQQLFTSISKHQMALMSVLLLLRPMLQCQQFLPQEDICFQLWKVPL